MSRRLGPGNIRRGRMQGRHRDLDHCPRHGEARSRGTLRAVDMRLGDGCCPDGCKPQGHAVRESWGSDRVRRCCGGSHWDMGVAKR